MATYLQGVTDYIPQVQPWTPNFNFYQSVLERKQNQYNQGWEQVNSLYNSILNAPMMREQNINRRDKFFKEIEQQIDQIASVDLSLSQNVDIANQVFKPFYEDDNIVKDIGFTKKYQDELSLAETYRKCTTKECKGKYWQGGVRALQHYAGDFVNASDEDALRMRNPEYTPYVNFMEKATQAAKDAGLSVKFDTREGGYIVTTKNGPALQMPLMNFFMSRFGDDPELQQFYSTKAYLMTKENPEQAKLMYQHAMMAPGASPEQLQMEAEKTGMVNQYEESKNQIETSKEREGNRFLTLVKKKRAIETHIKKKGIIPGSEEANNFMQLTNDIDEQDRIVKKINGYSEDVRLTDEGLNQFGIAGNEEQMRGVIAHSMQMSDFHNAAVSLSYKDYERTMKADQFALEATRHKNRVQLQNLKYQQDINKMEYKNVLDQATTRQDYLLKEGIIDPMTMQPYSKFQEGSLYNGGFGNAYTPMLGGGSGNTGTSTNRLESNLGTEGGQTENNPAGNLFDPVRKLPVGSENSVDTELVDKIIQGKAFEGFNEYRNKYQSFSNSWKENALNNKKEVGGQYIRNMLNMAADKNNTDQADQAQIELLHLGNLIQKKITDLDKSGIDFIEWSMNPIAQLDDDIVEKLRKFPSDTKNIDNINTDYFASIVNDWDKIMEAVGGDGQFYKFITEGEGVWVPHPESGKSVLQSDIAPDLTQEQSTALQNKAHNIATAKSDAYLEGVPYTGPELSDTEKKNLQMIEYLEDAGSYERKYAAGSEISLIKDFFNQNSTVMSLIKIADESAKKADEMFNNAGLNAWKATKAHYSLDKFSATEKVMAENIWVPGKNGSLGRIKSKKELYNDLLRYGVHTVDGIIPESGTWYTAGGRKSINDLFTGDTWTATQAEDNLGFTIDNDNLLFLMTKSEYRKGAPDNFGGSYPDMVGLQEEMRKVNQYLAGEDPETASIASYEVMNLDGGGKYSGALDYIYDNRHLLNLERDGGELKVSIKDEYQDVPGVYGGYRSFDLANAEVDDSYWEILDDHANDAYDKVITKFLSKAQSQDSPYSLSSLGGGQGSFAAPELSFQMTPTIKNDNYYYGVDVIKDALANTDAVSGSGDVNLLTQFYQDNTVGKQWSRNDDGVPFGMIEFKPISGDINSSELKITFSDQYLKELGYNTGKKDSPTVDPTQIYKIENSNSMLKNQSMPNMFDALIPMKGDSYTETSMSDVGTFTYTNLGNGNISVKTEAQFFDPESGTYVPYAIDDIEFSQDGTDWIIQHEAFLQNLQNLKILSDYNRQQYTDIMGTRDLNELNAYYNGEQ